MPVKGKKKYQLYLEPSNVEYVRSFLKSTIYQGGMSGLVNDYIATLAKALMLSKYKPGEKVSSRMLLDLIGKGAELDPQ